MLAWIVQNSLIAAALAVVVALVCRWKRVGPALRHALWVLVLVRLLWPPGLINWPWTVPLPAPPVEQAESIEMAAREPIAAEPVPAAVREEIVIQPMEPTDLAVMEPVAAVQSPEPIAWGTLLGGALLAAWIGGACFVAGRHIIGIVKLVRVVRRSQAPPPALVRHVGETARRLQVRPPPVRVVPGLGSPLIAGLLRPVLLWPVELQHRLSDDGFKAILIHELAHLRRRDHWVRWIEMAAACLWWWNPLFRLARRRVRQYAELACDAWVLSVLPRARRAYAEALLCVCESVGRAPEPAAVLGVNGDPADFQRRLTMIMRESVTCRVPKRAFVLLAALTLLTVPGWTLGEPPAESPVEPSTPVVTVEEDIEVILGDVLDLDVEMLNKQPDREQKLADLETQIQQLLAELHALRAQRDRAKVLPPTAAKRDSDPAKQAPDARTKEAALPNLVSPTKLLDRLREQANAAGAPKTARPGEVLLYRVIYPLKNDRAEALARFLTQTVSGSLHECRVSGDTITITTRPENQTIIARLIQLMNDLPSRTTR